MAEMSCTNIYDRCKAKYEGLTTSPLTLATDLTRRLVLAQTHVNRHRAKQQPEQTAKNDGAKCQLRPRLRRRNIRLKTLRTRQRIPSTRFRGSLSVSACATPGYGQPR